MNLCGKCRDELDCACGEGFLLLGKCERCEKYGLVVVCYCNCGEDKEYTSLVRALSEQGKLEVNMCEEGVPIPESIRVLVSQICGSEFDIEKWWITPANAFLGRSSAQVYREEGEEVIVARLEALLTGNVST